MAQRSLETEALTCAVCLELLKEPLTAPCGHSFCSSCIQSHWDGEESQSEYSCPECRESFSQRPVLCRNIKMDTLLQQVKDWDLKTHPLEDNLAGPLDVPCDVCSGMKLKAVHSCLQCLVSYCEAHLQPHRDVAGLQRHQLVAPSTKLQEYFCTEHNEVKKIFCRSDQQLTCVICCMDQHKGHETVSAAAERALRQQHLEDMKQQLLLTIQKSETDLTRMQEEAQAISNSAQDAVQRSADSFTKMILLLEKRRSEMEQLIRDQEKSALRQVQEHQDKVQMDLSLRKKTLSEMDTLLNSVDDNYFLEHFSDLPSHRQTPALSPISADKRQYFESVNKAMSALYKKIQLSLIQSEAEVSTALREVDTLLPGRGRFLKYACDITLDPNTASNYLRLSQGNRRVTKSTNQSYPHHPSRFKECAQVLSTEALTGRCYWEVEWTGHTWVRVAVAYRDTWKHEAFGDNEGSWVLEWFKDRYYYRFNRVWSEVPGEPSSRLGVFLDPSVGLLSFYSVKDETLSLIHTVQTTFTQPLFAGVLVWNNEETVHFPRIN